MKKSPHLLKVLLGTCLITIVACSSAKKLQTHVNGSRQTVGTIDRCNQTIKYYANKLKGPDGGQEIDANTEIVINPSTKLISLTSEPPGQEKVSFDTVIESFDCNFNSDLTEGQSIYKGYIQQKDGSITKITIKVEAKDGGLTMSSADPEHEGGLTILVARWEVVGE